jgi:hypothetical protein
MLNKYNIGIDWLTIFGHGNCLTTKDFSSIVQNYSTPIFKEVSKLFYKNQHFATVTQKPHSPLLNQNLFLLQVSNPFLYSQRMTNILAHYLHQSCVKPKGISRLDLFCDFQEFINGVTPIEFINKVLSGELRKMGKSHFGTAGAAQELNNSDTKSPTFSNFAATGQSCTVLDYNYLRFGTRSANSFTYMYNKTKELAQVKDKQYISSTWQAVGMDTSRDVWRLEYSYKPSKMKNLSFNTGEYSPLSIKDLSNPVIVRETYFSALNQYFRFKVVTGDTNISRLPDFDLFPDSVPYFKLSYIPSTQDTTQQAKRLIRALIKQLNELDENYDILKLSIIDTITGMLSWHSLNDWMHKKHPEFFDLQNSINI